MKLTTSREALLKPLQAVIGVVERRQTMPILANVMLTARKGELTIAGTDLEVEMVATAEAENVSVPGEITVPGRKLLDIARALPESASLTLTLEGDRFVIKSGRSRFVLATLPAAEFPLVEKVDAANKLRIAQEQIRGLLEKTQFSMAQQDVRYYLNGLLLETTKKVVRAVATDGHRLALAEIAIEKQDVTAAQVIVPRKGVIELSRLLNSSEDIELVIGTNHLRVTVGQIRFTSKLIDGRFPDYERVIPASPGSVMLANRETLRQSLQRAAILSNEKYRGIRWEVSKNLLRLQANNPDQEEAQEEVEVQYSGEAMEIGFNVTYLLDALAAITTEDVEVALVDPNSSCLIRPTKSTQSKYVVMPMRL
jgi:DNA polymerase-3 subunit beta